MLVELLRHGDPARLPPGNDGFGAGQYTKEYPVLPNGGQLSRRDCPPFALKRSSPERCRCVQLVPAR